MGVDRLYKAALEAFENAYAPYSNFKVGAAVETKSGRIFTGCNIENVAYSPTVCAERVAIFKAVSEGERDIKRIMVVTDTDKLWPSCGPCRQVMAEFGLDVEIIAANLHGKKRSFLLKDLFPEAFVPEALQK